MPTCPECLAEVIYVGGRPGTYCSTRCRMRAHRRAQVPARMRRQDRWVRHTATKVPLTLKGTAASSVDPKTWSSWRAARDSHVGSGLGFVLNGDGIVCIDLDHCLTDRLPSKTVQHLLDTVPEAYIEVSPSGDGLHLWGLGDIPRGRLRRLPCGQTVELYGTARYITVTRRPFQAGRLVDLTPVIEQLLAG